MNTKRTSAFLMANLGSEIFRLYNLKKQERKDDVKKSAQRAISIANKIIAHSGVSGVSREARILKKIVEDMVSSSPVYKVSNEDLHSYFLPISLKVLSV